MAFVQTTLRLAGREVEACNTLIAPAGQRATIAVAGKIRIRVASGAAAFVVNTGKDIAILALHEARLGDISIRACDQEFQLHAGEQLIVSSNGNSNQRNPIPGLAVRDCREHALSDGSAAIVSDFSLPSAVTSLQTLSALRRSSSASDRALYERMLKNACVLQAVNAGKGAYRR